MKATVLIPVKALSEAKSRLAEYLTNNERENLVLTMLQHVLQTVKSTDAELYTIVVSSDKKICKLAMSLHIKTFPEIIHGQNEALTEAAHHIDSSLPLLTLSADLPLVTTEDINRMVVLGETYDVILAPSKEKTGTNAILLRKPLILPYLFGANSLKKFISAAEKQKLSNMLYESESLAFDVDTIKDLKKTNFLQKFHLESVS